MKISHKDYINYLNLIDPEEYQYGDIMWVVTNGYLKEVPSELVDLSVNVLRGMDHCAAYGHRELKVNSSGFNMNPYENIIKFPNEVMERERSEIMTLEETIQYTDKVLYLLLEHLYRNQHMSQRELESKLGQVFNYLNNILSIIRLKSCGGYKTDVYLNTRSELVTKTIEYEKRLMLKYNREL